MEESKLEAKQDSNLDKIKSLREEKKKKKLMLPGEELSAKDLLKKEEEDTKIRIVRKNDDTAKNIIKETGKGKGKKDKTDKQDNLGNEAVPEEFPGESEKLIDREKEATYPNQWEEIIKYTKPSLDLLEPAPVENYKVAEEELTRNAELLKEKFKTV